MNRLLAGFVLGCALGLLTRRRPLAVRVLRISRFVADLGRAEAFYRDGLGFRRIASGPTDPALLSLLGLGNVVADEVVLRLGDQEIALIAAHSPASDRQEGGRSKDLWFQHLAIVVNDMAAAYRHLLPHAPRPISVDGPELLPPRNGGVSAFKFRDPDGHPLELIHFPPKQGREIWHTGSGGPFLGIDHTAIAVAATRRSRRFYRRLGFRVAARSINYGSAQSRLDGLSGAVVRVTGLQFPNRVPGLELLAYRPPGRSAGPVHGCSSWTTLLVPGLRGGAPLADGRQALVRRDPDGHVMLLVDEDGE